MDYRDEVFHYLETYEFDKLLEFTNYSLCELVNAHIIHGNCLYYLLLCENNKIIKHVISNTHNINFRDNASLIHYLCRYLEDDKLFIFLIEKYRLDINIEYFGTKRKPIYFACWSGSLNKIRCLINKGADLEYDIKEIITKNISFSDDDRRTLFIEIDKRTN